MQENWHFRIWYLFLNSENRLGRQREDIEWPEDDEEDTIKADIDGSEVAPDIPTNHNCKLAAITEFFWSSVR